MKRFLVVFLGLIGLTGTLQAQTLPFFQDNFDTGAKQNANGFLWGAASNNVTVSNERAYSGTYSLQFSYTGKPSGQDATAEQRFNMGQYISEVWIEYMLYIPTNYFHRNDVPNNNKWFFLWRDRYDTKDSAWAMGFETRPTNSKTGSTSSFLRVYARSSTSLGSLDIYNGNAQNPLIGPTGPLVIGQWNRIRIHVRTSNPRAIRNGVLEFWANNTKLVNITNGDFSSFAPRWPDTKMRNGYFMGWSNSGFTETTTFYIDDVKFYNRSPNWTF